MAFGMDAGMYGHRRTSTPTMHIMIAYRKASTRMRFRGDGMVMLSMSDVITIHHPVSQLSSLSLFCDNFLRHPVLLSFFVHAYLTPLLFYSRYLRSVSTTVEESRKQSTTHRQTQYLFWFW